MLKWILFSNVSSETLRDSVSMGERGVGGKTPRGLCAVITVWARSTVCIDLNVWAVKLAKNILIQVTLFF